jgi:hypothetical protein
VDSIFVAGCNKPWSDSGLPISFNYVIAAKRGNYVVPSALKEAVRGHGNRRSLGIVLILG